MIDISKQKVEIDCPNCKLKVEVTIKQVCDEASVVCLCGQTMTLQDKDNSMKNEVKKVNDAFVDLEKTIRNIQKK